MPAVHKNIVVTNKAAKHTENHLRTYRKHSFIFTNHIKGRIISSVADPGSGAFLTLDPGSGIGFFRISDPGSQTLFLIA
jgi:hypothetical protein